MSVFNYIVLYGILACTAGSLLVDYVDLQNGNHRLAEVLRNRELETVINERLERMELQQANMEGKLDGLERRKP